MSDRVYNRELDRHVPLGPDGETVVMVRNVALEEQLTEADLVGGAVTFAEPVHTIDFYNSSSVDGFFTVNGLRVRIKAGAGYGPIAVGGEPSAVVTVEGADSFTLGRFA